MRRLVSYVANKGWRYALTRTKQISRQFTFDPAESCWFSRRISARSKNSLKNKNIRFLLEPAKNSRIPDWIRSHKQDFPWIYYPKELDLALSEGHPYLTILDDEKIIGFIKIGINRVYIIDFDQVIRFPSNACFIYDSLVIPEYRGMHILSAAVSHAMAKLHPKGYRIIWAHIADYNRSSLRAFGHIGFAKRTRINYIHISRFWIFVRDGFFPFRNLESLIKEMSKI